MIGRILFLMGILLGWNPIFTQAQQFNEGGLRINETQSPAMASVDETTPFVAPLDSPYERTNLKDRRLLPYDHIREADVMWEKRLWREIDVREKMNLYFADPENPLISILLDNIESGKIRAYSPLDDKFTTPLPWNDLSGLISGLDTITIYDPDTYEPKTRIVRNDFDPTTVKKFRVKESWFFDTETSTMQVRILGIAPIKEDIDDYGNVRFEYPLFWVYYPHCREPLARVAAFNPLNDKQTMSWEDMLEMRYFASHITKASNVYNRRIEDYKSGADALYESEKIKETIRNYEHDLWSY